MPLKGTPEPLSFPVLPPMCHEEGSLSRRLLLPSPGSKTIDLQCRLPVTSLAMLDDIT